MQLTWTDYPAQYAEVVEGWCDESAHEYALDEDTIAEEHQSYLDDEYRLGYNYFCKVALDEDIPVALLMLAVDEDASKVHLHEDIVYIETLIVNPAVRQKGYATKVMQDVIQHADKLIDHADNVFVAQIHKDNDSSIKLYKKLGFTLIRTDDDEDDDWFNWVYPASAAEPFCAICNE